MISSRKDDNKTGDIDTKINDYISYTKTNNATAYSFQNQTFKELGKQNEFMKNFSNNA